MPNKFFPSIVTLILFTFLTPFITLADEKEDETWIIGFDSNINLSVFEEIPHEVHYTYDTIQAISISLPSIYIEDIKQHKEIQWIEKDRKVQMTGQVTDWGYTTVVRSETNELGLTGKGVKIGIIDTGVYSDHPDLQIAGGVSFISGSPSYEDDQGHGTHVAGIIGAQNNEIGMVGVAPDAEIYAIKALDNTGEGQLKNVIAGIEWAIENEMDIINLSLVTSTPTPALEKVIARANEQGIIIVASTGNVEDEGEQSTDDILYPARYPGVIGVGAINEELLQSDFSYVGPSISLSAPGEEIFSTYIPVDGQMEVYAEASGTSMAAPFVTGVIALYLEQYPYLDREELKTILLANIVDLGEEGRDDIYGYGLLKSPDVPFWDLRSNAWYSKYVNFLISKDYVNGFKDGTFKPDNLITRGEVVTLVGRALGLDGEKQETTFQDVDASHYASGYVASAVEKEIITGFPDQSFKPSANISRGEVAVIIKRAFEIAESEKQLFHDVPNNKYYAKAINSLAEEAVITGYTDGSFEPDKQISRAEFSIILAKALDPMLR